MCQYSTALFLSDVLRKLPKLQVIVLVLAASGDTGVLRRTSIKIQVTGTTMPSVTHPLQAASLAGHDAFVEGVEFSSNGKYIMSSSSGELKTILC